MTGSVRKGIVARLVAWRSWIQAAFLVFWLDPFMLRMHYVCGPVFHCYSCPLATFACPIGVLANFSALHLVPLIAIGTLVAIGALVGTAVCGWACPFGFMQDLLGKVPLPKFRLPRWMGVFRYAVLVALVITIPYLFGENHRLFFCAVCPAGALEGGLPNAAKLAAAGEPVVWPNALKLTILGILLLSALFTLRPWCAVLCPLGGIFGLFNRFSVLTLRFRAARCKECNHCEQMCPYNVLPARNVNNSRCIRCFKCTRCQALKVEAAWSDPNAPARGEPHDEVQSTPA